MSTQTFSYRWTSWICQGLAAPSSQSAVAGDGESPEQVFLRLSLTGDFVFLSKSSTSTEKTKARLARAQSRITPRGGDMGLYKKYNPDNLRPLCTNTPTCASWGILIDL